jgi:hypothetical protein
VTGARVFTGLPLISVAAQATPVIWSTLVPPGVAAQALALIAITMAASMRFSFMEASPFQE